MLQKGETAAFSVTNILHCNKHNLKIICFSLATCCDIILVGMFITDTAIIFNKERQILLKIYFDVYLYLVNIIS